MQDLKNNTVARRKLILQRLEENNEIFVHDLSNEFNVSEVTIRNDLNQLEKKNMLIKVRGGAIKVESPLTIDQNVSEKSKLNYQEKVLIGKKASEFIKDSETILLDSGSTTMELAKNLANVKDVTVLTHALNIANHLATFPDVDLIVLGGYLRKKSYSLIGPLAENALNNFYVDKLFIGVDGFDLKTGGIYTTQIEEAHLNRIMIENAQEVIIVTDSSKFNRRSYAFICELDKIDKVITDKKILKEDKQNLIQLGIEVFAV